MRVLPASHYRRMPWKNGGGQTVEIASAPAGASLDGFDWRVSMAHVAIPGPFSIFPGVERSLSVLSAAGLVLDFGDRGLVRLDRSSAAFTFPGDVPVQARLTGGPVDDLNVMTRRGRCRHQVSRRTIEGPVTLGRRGAVVLVLPLQAGLRAACCGQVFTLAAGDAGLCGAGGGGCIELIPEGATELFVIDLWPAAAG